MPRIAARAYAKVNLALALGPPEPPGSARPGWHPICTWMHAIDLADDLLVEPLGTDAASTWSATWAPDAPRPGLVDWPPERDLAWRALLALEVHVGRKLPTRIVLHKRIPAGSGLGGGSADAAAALVAIDRAWNLRLGLDTLRSLGASLGSDVPFFLDEEHPPRPAIVSGFGETIERTARAASALVLMVPTFGCPTAAVYKAFDRQGASHAGWQPRADLVRTLAAGANAGGGGLFNDLARPACAVRPQLAGLIAAARDAAGCEVHVTGSGSGLFVPHGREEAQGLSRRLRDSLPGVLVLPVRLI